MTSPKKILPLISNIKLFPNHVRSSLQHKVSHLPTYSADFGRVQWIKIQTHTHTNCIAFVSLVNHNSHRFTNLIKYHKNWMFKVRFISKLWQKAQKWCGDQWELSLWQYDYYLELWCLEYSFAERKLPNPIKASCLGL